MSARAVQPAPLSCACEGRSYEPLFVYDAPPPGETRFPFSTDRPYRREVLRCTICQHCVSVHDMDVDALYEGEYVSATYGDDGMRRAFERIVALDPARSDNVGRVQRMVEFAAGHFAGPRALSRPPSVLDVGSGLCVFLHQLKAAGWDCTALDPDARAVRHARERVGVRALQGDFNSAEGLGCFDVVTFNKVLEHVQDPVQMLARAAALLNPGGFVYLELPDADAAAEDGPDREEFFVDHWHVFSAASLALLAGRAGFRVKALERLREPSTKYTLRAFLTLD